MPAVDSKEASLKGSAGVCKPTTANPGRWRSSAWDDGHCRWQQLQR